MRERDGLSAAQAITAVAAMAALVAFLSWPVGALADDDRGDDRFGGSAWNGEHHSDNECGDDGERDDSRSGGRDRGDALRFLGQSSFGATTASLARVMQIGVRCSLEEQLRQAPTGYPPMTAVSAAQPATCKYDGNPASAASICARDNYSIFQVQRLFYRNAVSGADQLRQRVAFALSQIEVISGLDVNLDYAMGAYQQLLLQDAFTNYRQILDDVTLSPAMGHYLNMVNNVKANPALGTKPNENYAREFMQLFSVGLVQLNQDGTPVLSGGKPVPTYTQAVVDDMARVFTGWTYPTAPGATAAAFNPAYYFGPMIPVETHHDTGTKTILGGKALPAGQSAEVDLSDTIDIVFNHPNVGPFVAKLLIEHLVTSNPSPAYVARVAAAFAGRPPYGKGERGDMKAVLRAILLDREARGDVKTQSSYGKLQEPALFAAAAVRSLGGQTDGVYLRNAVPALGQDVFNAPSVFSFYPPAYPLPGNASLIGPEFGILNTATAIGRDNLLQTLIFGSPIAADPTVSGSTGTSVNMAPWQALAANPTTLVDSLAGLTITGGLPSATAGVIVSAVSTVTASDTLTRARTAAYLLDASELFQVTR
jgi:uncharacterized protein (DUF1800 family)